MRVLRLLMCIGLAAGLSGSASIARAEDWPQGAGPNLDFRAIGRKAPTHWSVATGSNVIWRTKLPSGGQGGIAKWGNRLFLTTFEEYQEGGPKYSATILGHCLDAKDGRILWSVKLLGENPSPICYAYSDSTSWTPVTDGKHVWFFNASGEMGCWDFSGREVWRRKFLAPGEPFNKQMEPILLNGTIVTMEPLSPDDPRYRVNRKSWHFLRGIEAATGKTHWIADDASTYYCTPTAGRMPNGKWAILHGRGGPHDVPERPIGLSMTSLEPGSAGKTIWRFEPQDLPGGPVDGVSFMALYTMTWDRKFATWFRYAPEESHLLLDASTGTLVKSQSLIRRVDYRQWDPAKGAHTLHANVNIRDMKDFSPRVPLKAGEVLHVMPNWHSNLMAYGYHYFLTSTGHRRNAYAPPGLSGPSHCIGRVNVATGKVKYLEVPVGVRRAPGKPEERLYGQALTTSTRDNNGREIAPEDRSRTDGWQIPAFFGSPIAADGKVYFTTMLGVTYVVNGKAKVLDERALIAVNDLGPLGETWSLNTPTVAGGRLYHRSLREVVCAGGQ